MQRNSRPLVSREDAQPPLSVESQRKSLRERHGIQLIHFDAHLVDGDASHGQAPARRQVRDAERAQLGGVDEVAGDAEADRQLVRRTGRKLRPELICSGCL